MTQRTAVVVGGASGIEVTDGDSVRALFDQAGALEVRSG